MTSAPVNMVRLGSLGFKWSLRGLNTEVEKTTFLSPTLVVFSTLSKNKTYGIFSFDPFPVEDPRKNRESTIYDNTIKLPGFLRLNEEKTRNACCAKAVTKESFTVGDIYK